MAIATTDSRDEPCVQQLLASIFAPQDAVVVLVSAPGGTGKTFASLEIAYDLVDKLGYYLLTNIPFVQKSRSKSGWVRVNPHERAKVVMTMRDLWYQYGLIKQKDPYAYILVQLDEWHKWLDRLKSADQMAINFKNWWGEDRKYRTIPDCITQKMDNIPRRVLKYVVWYVTKSKTITDEYNARYNRSFDVKDLAFIIPISAADELESKEEKDFTLAQVSEVLYIERGPWTGDPNTAKLGQICYFSESSSNFEMGKVRESEEWFDEFLSKISGCHPTELGDRIIEFFDEDPSRETDLMNYPRGDIAMHLHREHLSQNPPKHGEHPIIKLSTFRGRKLVPVELNPTNLSRICLCSQQTLSRKLEKLT